MLKTDVFSLLWPPTHSSTVGGGWAYLKRPSFRSGFGGTAQIVDHTGQS